MKGTLDLKPAHLAIVRRILAETAPHAQVLAYGSRVNGCNHDASDLDLVLRDPTDPLRQQRGLASITAAFSESNLPIIVDVLDWARLPDDSREQIEEQHVVLQAGG